MREASTYLLDKIYIRANSTCKLYRQIVGIPTITECAPRFADSFLILVLIFLMINRMEFLTHSILHKDLYLDDFKILTIQQSLLCIMRNRINPHELQ